MTLQPLAANSLSATPRREEAMALENSVMSGDNGSIELTLARMEGKIDRMGDRIERYEKDTQGVRQRLHDLANEVTLLTMLNLPAFILQVNADKAKNDARLQALEDMEMQRKGAQATIRVLWGILGAVGVSGIAAVVRLLQIGGI